MRDFKGMKRQRGRNRGGGGGGKPQQQNTNRAFDSNGPEGIKVRGNAQHVFEKYQQLARDANSAGDRVLGENYLQHAEHYFRLLRAMQPTRPASEILGRDNFSSGYDIDFEDETARAQAEAADAAAPVGGNGQGPPEGDAEGGWQAREGGERQDRPRDERPRDDRPRFEDRPRDRFEGRDGGRRDRWRDERGPRDDRAPRDDRPRFERDDRPRDDRPRDDRPRDERPRDDRPREERPRDDRPRFERDDRGPRDERPRFERDRDRPRDDRPREDRGEPRDPLAVVEPQAQPPFSGGEERASPVLRDAEGGESHAPAFLQAATPRTEPADGDAPRPRRRRAPRGAAAPSEADDA